MSLELTTLQSDLEFLKEEDRVSSIQTLITKLTGEFCLYKDNTFYFPDEALDYITEEMEDIIKRYTNVNKIVYTSGIGLIK